MIGLTSAALLPFCSSTNLGNGWGWKERGIWVLIVTGWGGLGSLLDSLLGGLLQASVVDKRSGKVVEGIGGQKVRYTSFVERDNISNRGPSTGIGSRSSRLRQVYCYYYGG